MVRSELHAKEWRLIPQNTESVSKFKLSTSQNLQNIFWRICHLYSPTQTLSLQPSIPEVCANAALNSARPTLVVGLSSAEAIKEEGDKGLYQIKQHNYPGKHDCLFFVKGKLSQSSQVSYSVKGISQWRGRHRTGVLDHRMPPPETAAQSLLPPAWGNPSKPRAPFSSGKTFREGGLKAGFATVCWEASEKRYR